MIVCAAENRIELFDEAQLDGLLDPYIYTKLMRAAAPRAPEKQYMICCLDQ